MAGPQKQHSEAEKKAARQVPQAERALPQLGLDAMAEQSGPGLVPRARANPRLIAPGQVALLQRAFGNRAVTRLLPRRPARLSRYEQGGDRVARHALSLRNGPAQSDHNLVQLKEIKYDDKKQEAEEGKTHYTKTIHFITRHGPKVSDKHQEDRLNAQVAIFRKKRDEQVADLRKDVLNYQKGITKLESQISGSPKHKKVGKWRKQVNNKRSAMQERDAKILYLRGIQEGSDNMIREMEKSSRRSTAYRDDLKKSNFGAGTPTQVVSRFEITSEMHSAAREFVESNKTQWEQHVGEAGEKDDDKQKGKLRATGDKTVKFTTHKLVAGPSIAKEEKTAKASIEITFVAEDKGDDITKRAEPILLLAETGYTTV